MEGLYWLLLIYSRIAETEQSVRSLEHSVADLRARIAAVQVAPRLRKIPEDTPHDLAVETARADEARTAERAVVMEELAKRTSRVLEARRALIGYRSMLLEVQARAFEAELRRFR